MVAAKQGEELVVSWDDSPAIHVERVPSPPTVTGVGVRPERLTYHGPAIYYPSHAEWYEYMHRRLTHLASVALKTHRAAQVITSLTLGWDTALAEAATALQIPVRVALPYMGLQTHWHLEHKQRYSRLVAKAEEVTTLHQGGYKPWKFKQAHVFRILESDLLFMLWDGVDSTGKELITLSRKHEKEVVNLWGSWVKYGQLTGEEKTVDHG